MRNLYHRSLALLLAVVLVASMVAPASRAAAAGGGIGAVATSLPNAQWQLEISFPDGYGYVDDTLAMNSLASFTNFRNQGALYVTVAPGVTSFKMFVNNVEVNTSAMAAGNSYRVDISAIALDGTNTVQVTNILPYTLSGAVTVRAPYPTVISGNPAEVGMDEDIVGLINDFINAEVKYGFSGAQLAVVKDGKLVISEAYGLANGYHADGTPIVEGDDDYVPVTTDTLYDLASNTKMYSVNYALQYMLSHDGYNIGLDDPITKFFPEFDDEGVTVFKAGTSVERQAEILAWKSSLTIRDILMHQAGFDPDPQYHNDKFDQVTQAPNASVDNPLFSQDRATTLTKVLASPLNYAPGSRTVYSDVDYMLLCFIIEQVAGQRLDEFLKETFWNPMGLTHMTYNPLENGFTKEDCAATELQGNTRGEAAHGQLISFQNVRTDTVWGEVHDEKAYYAMDGISGHAGLFSNAEDLAKLASVMLTGGYGGLQFFEKNVIDEFIKPKSTGAATWGLGWWRQAELGRRGYFTSHASNATIGHQGWTGTLTVIDPEENLVVVLLTNKKNSPVLDNTIAANDFYSDNMVLGALGTVVGYTYEALRSSPDAMDASVMQLAKERIRLMISHRNAYDEAPHMNDAFALVDLVVTRAERRLSDVTKQYAVDVLKDLKDFVAIYIQRPEDIANAAIWTAELQARIDAIVPTGAAPAAPGLTAVPTSSSPHFDGSGNFIGGDMNAVFFPRAYGANPGTSGVYNSSVTWFDSYAGQGTVYLKLGSAVSSFRMFVNGVEVDNSNLLGQTGIFAIDVSAVTRNGRNALQITDMDINKTRRDVLIAVGNPTVVTGTPAEVGLDSKALDMIDSIIQSDVDHGFTSAQLAVVKDGKLVYSNAWGTVNAYNTDGTAKTDSAAVTTDTLYDLASNTKMYATNYAIQYLVQQGSLRLDTPITSFFPNFVNDTIEINYRVSQGTGAPDLETAKAWKSQLTVADILQHQAGFAPDPQFHNNKFDQVTQSPDPNTDNVLYAIGKDAVAAAICKAPLVYEPGTKTVYSDVDYMLLGLIIEQVTGRDLDTVLKETFYTPLGLTHITFNPLDHGFTADQIAATELNGNSRDGVISFDGIRTGTIQGTVHDEKAYYAMGGVSGHAGLFSNAEDLAKLAQMMLNPTGYGTNRLFGANVNEYFTSRKDSSATWGQGWWRQGDCGRPWYFGVQASRGTIGHQGWTGTLTVIDPAEDLVVVYLTNKINSPVTDNTTNPNRFDGNWYTSSTLGFVTNILYQGLSSNNASADIQPALDALLGDMAIDKVRLADAEDTFDPTHPIEQATQAIADLVYEMADQRPTTGNLAAAATLSAALNRLEEPGSAYDRQLRVMTYNIRYGTSNDGVYALQPIADVITQSGADVVCLQEVDVNWGARSQYEDTLAILAEMTGMNHFNAYIYDRPSQRGPEYPNERFGVAFLSKYPILASANHEITRWSTQAGDPQPGDENFPGTKPGFGEILVDVNGVSVRLYNTHLDYRGAPPEGYPHTIRVDQVRDMLAIMNLESVPTILTGDMNADVSNPAAAEVFDPLLEKLTDVWAEKGRGTGNSYPALNPDRRIDYILTTAATIDVVNAYTINSQATDHQPVVADLIIHGTAPIVVPVPDGGGTTQPPTQPDQWTNPYHDVPGDAWYYDAVRFVTEQSLFSGVPGGGFAPSMLMSRAMLVTVLHRAAKTPAGGQATFTDVPDGQWYTQAVRWAASNGIVNGNGAGLFDPNGNVTREQIAVILYQYAKHMGAVEAPGSGALARFADGAAVSSWAAEAMGWAVEQGLVSGRPGNLLAPGDTATRAEVAAILMRFLSK